MTPDNDIRNNIMRNIMEDNYDYISANINNTSIDFTIRGISPFILSVLRHNIEICKLYINHGCDVNGTYNEKSALMIAWNSMRFDMVCLLIESECDWNIIYKGKYFFDMLDEGFGNYIKKTYPEQYDNYLTTRAVLDYNL